MLWAFAEMRSQRERSFRRIQNKMFLCFPHKHTAAAVNIRLPSDIKLTRFSSNFFLLNSQSQVKHFIFAFSRVLRVLIMSNSCNFSPLSFQLRRRRVLNAQCEVLEKKSEWKENFSFPCAKNFRSVKNDEKKLKWNGMNELMEGVKNSSHNLIFKLKNSVRKFTVYDAVLRRVNRDEFHCIYLKIASTWITPNNLLIAQNCCARLSHSRDSEIIVNMTSCNIFYNEFLFHFSQMTNPPNRSEKWETWKWKNNFAANEFSPLAD